MARQKNEQNRRRKNGVGHDKRELQSSRFFTVEGTCTMVQKHYGYLQLERGHQLHGFAMSHLFVQSIYPTLSSGPPSSQSTPNLLLQPLPTLTFLHSVPKIWPEFGGGDVDLALFRRLSCNRIKIN